MVGFGWRVSQGAEGALPGHRLFGSVDEPWHCRPNKSRKKSRSSWPSRLHILGQGSSRLPLGSEVTQIRVLADRAEKRATVGLSAAQRRRARVHGNRRGKYDLDSRVRMGELVETEGC